MSIASMARSTSSEGDASPQGFLRRLIDAVKEAFYTPFRILTSSFALRAYITSILFAFTALILFGVAVAAYTLFYWSYIPRIGFERQIHLQFDPLPAECLSSDISSSSALLTQCAGPSAPYGLTTLTPDLISRQQYDISTILHVPRSPTNLEIGNFMLDAKLYAPLDKSSPTSVPSTNPLDTFKSGLMLTSSEQSTPDQPALAHARRPAILHYTSREMDLIHKASVLPWYILGWTHESETLTIPLFESVEFAKGWRNVPSSMRVEIQTPSRKQMQIYDAKVVFRARFSGLRWVMYNYRMVSAAVFVGCFWSTEMVFAGLAWLILGQLLAGGEEDVMDDGRGRRLKEEDERNVKEEYMSDTERSFPTYGRQPPIRYTRPVKMEDEEVLEHSPERLVQIPPVTGVDADVEDEDGADFVLDEITRWRDSGMGTSMESGSNTGRSSVRRRRSKPEEGGLL